MTLRKDTVGTWAHDIIRGGKRELKMCTVPYTGSIDSNRSLKHNYYENTLLIMILGGSSCFLAIRKISSIQEVSP